MNLSQGISEIKLFRECDFFNLVVQELYLKSKQIYIWQVPEVAKHIKRIFDVWAGPVTPVNYQLLLNTKPKIVEF